MEQVFVVLAVIVWMLIQGATRTRRRPGSGSEPLPRAAGDEQADAQERAMEALRRWEARQRAAGSSPDDFAGAPIEPPGRRPEPPRRRPLVSEPAGRSRREAYEAISEVLGRRTPVPPVPEDESVRSLETLVPAGETPRRRRPPSKGRVVAGERRRAPVPRPERVSAVRRRARAAAEETTPARSPSRGLGRLDSLPPLARAVVLAEILGRPPSLPDGPSRS